MPRHFISVARGWINDFPVVRNHLPLDLDDDVDEDVDVQRLPGSLSGETG